MRSVLYCGELLSDCLFVIRTGVYSCNHRRRCMYFQVRTYSVYWVMANQEGYITRSKERTKGDDVVSSPKFSSGFTGTGRQADENTVQSRNTEQTQPTKLLAAAAGGNAPEDDERGL